MFILPTAENTRWSGGSTGRSGLSGSLSDLIEEREMHYADLRVSTAIISRERKMQYPIPSSS